MAGPFDFFSQPILSPAMGEPQGALSPYYVNPSDPKTAALLDVAGSLLSAGGPSPRPVSVGQALGAGINQGLNTYQAVQHANLQNAVLGQQFRKAQQEAELTNMVMQGGGLAGLNDPDKLEMIGARLAAAGHPGGATLIDRAQKLRTAQQNALAVQGFRSAPGTLGAGVTTTSPQGQALLGNLTGDPEFDKSVLAAQNDALNSNARPEMPAQPVAAPNPGLFGALANSPYVGSSAAAMQRMVDTSPSSGLNPTNILAQYTHLAQQDSSARDRAEGRQQNADLRRELQGNALDTRTQLAEIARQGREAITGGLADQRKFAKEQNLAKQYNGITKNFRIVLPQVDSATQYINGGKYDSSGDRSLVFQFAKTLDPNDRVGVNDVKDIGKLGGVPERITQAVQSLAEGKMLPDRIRQEMFAVMKQRFLSMNEQQAGIENEYEDRAKRYMLDPSNVVIRYSQRKTLEYPGKKTGTTGVIDFNDLPRSQ